MLDERFRQFVREVAEADERVLDVDAHERILARVVAEGPRHVRQGRRAQWVTIAGPLVAAAAAVTVLFVHHQDARRNPPAPVVAASAASPACAARPVADGARAGFVASPDGPRLDLGVVAFAAGSPGTVVGLSDAAPCRTLLTLQSGTVAVHAINLAGGELRVRAPGGEVTVHGTIFAVTQDADTFTVEVAEGRVGVTDRAGAQTVSGGERLMISATGVVHGPLSAERARAVRAAAGAPEVVGLDSLQPFFPPEPSRSTGRPVVPNVGARAAEPAAPAPEPSAVGVELAESGQEAAPAVHPAAPVDPLAQAEEARRAGDFQKARTLYRQAGDGVGPTAEAAWVALARMELSLGHAAAAREATNRRQARFGQGTLGPEALWIDVRTYRQTGEMDRARELAADLVRRWPSSPQARAAQQWLSGE